MNCLQISPNFRSSVPLLPRTKWGFVRASFSRLEMVPSNIRVPSALRANAATNSTEANRTEVQEERSDVYSNNMSQAMGAVLTYRHELGMRYNFIRPDLIVGSCLQTPHDVDKLIKVGVRTIFCLQKNSDLEFVQWHVTLKRCFSSKLNFRIDPGVETTLAKTIVRTNYSGLYERALTATYFLETGQEIDNDGKLDNELYIFGTRSCKAKSTSLNRPDDIILDIDEYFGVDIEGIRQYAKRCENIEHIRAEIRDFDAFDLRMRLPAVVSKLHKAINCNGGVTYIHCTAGLGRAPAVALAYMYWVLGYKLSEAHDFLQTKRPCCPKLEAIRTATADILTGLSKSRVRLTWEGDKYSSVEISGLDIGWGQRIPLNFNPSQGLWLLERDLPEGRYEYKYIVDGEWTHNTGELTTNGNGDGHVNNYIEISNTDSDSDLKALRKRLMAGDDLTQEERRVIREFLEQDCE